VVKEASTGFPITAAKLIILLTPILKVLLTLFLKVDLEAEQRKHH
jgi:hypothetical protein